MTTERSYPDVASSADLDSRVVFLVDQIRRAKAHRTAGRDDVADVLDDRMRKILREEILLDENAFETLKSVERYWSGTTSELRAVVDSIIS